MNNYVCGFSADGVFKCATRYKNEESLNRPKLLDRSVEIVEIVNQEYYTLYVQGYTRGDDGVPVAPITSAPTPEEQLAVAKSERAKAVASITVEVDGMIFDGDEKAQERMARAVTLADSPEEVTEWVLHDNTIAVVTAEQLRKACKLAGKAQTALWTKPYTDTVSVTETDTETSTHYTLE